MIWIKYGHQLVDSVVGDMRAIFPVSTVMIPAHFLLYFGDVGDVFTFPDTHTSLMAPRGFFVFWYPEPNWRQQSHNAFDMERFEIVTHQTVRKNRRSIKFHWPNHSKDEPSLWFSSGTQFACHARWLHAAGFMIYGFHFGRNHLVFRFKLKPFFSWKITKLNLSAITTRNCFYSNQTTCGWWGQLLFLWHIISRQNNEYLKFTNFFQLSTLFTDIFGMVKCWRRVGG